MTRSGSTDRLVSTAAPPAAAGLQEANRIADDIRSRWQAGESPDTGAAIRAHPELRRYRSIVLDLARVEYELRRQAGEPLSPEAFAERFPSLEQSLGLLIHVHDLLGEDSVRSVRDIAWPKPGDQFLDFELMGELGRGAFARVYLARERSLADRLVVLKMAPLAGEEAATLGQLRHANIVPVYSVQYDPESGLTAFCMPYLGRATLDDVIGRVHRPDQEAARPRTILDAVHAIHDELDPADFPPADAFLRGASFVDGAVHVAAQLAAALAHAHRENVFHRDLKPSNVLMALDGKPLLLDFNLSVTRQAPVQRIGGTLPYMTPEELSLLFRADDGGQLRYFDRRSDVFALGVVLYELLTGSLPFGPIPRDLPLAEAAQVLYRQQAGGPLPSEDKNREVDASLAALVRSCLAFDPARRPQSAEELADRLRRQLSRWRRGRRWAMRKRRVLLGLGSLLLVSGLAWGAFEMFRPPYKIRALQAAVANVKAGQPQSAIKALDALLQADPQDAEALFARGRAYQQLGDFRAAFMDFQAAGRLAPRPIINACIGYCLSRLEQWDAAAVQYQSALDGGFASPGVWNNLGYVYLRLRRFDAAEPCLLRAVAADLGLASSYHALVRLVTKRALTGGSMPASAFDWAERAVESGPDSTDLRYDVAAIYALGAGHDPAKAAAAVEQLAKAVGLGLDPRALRNDPVFAALKGRSDYERLLASGHVGTASPVRADFLVDPLPPGSW
jgi:serine/threonine protein kinase/Tfp pilus assembly protein PilF